MSKPTMNIKRGSVREDGAIFWGLIDGAFIWLSQDEFRIKKAEVQRTRRKKAIEDGTAKPAKKRVRDTPCDWKKKNPSKHCMTVKEWMKANPEKAREIRRRANAAYYAKNKAKFMDRWAQRKAIKAGATAADHDPVIARVLADCRDRLTACIGIDWHLDHIHPIAAGGVHAHYNLQVIPATWNARKRDNPTFPLPSCYKIPTKTNT